MSKKNGIREEQQSANQQPEILSEDQQPATPAVAEKALTPTVIEQVGTAAVEAETDPAIPKGHVQLVRLDAAGNEVGEPFTVSEAGYQRVYRNPKKYLLKKKAQ